MDHVDIDTPGSPAWMEDRPKSGHINPPASMAGVPLPTDLGTPDSANPAAYRALASRRGMHSVGAPAKGPGGSKMPTVGPISNK